MDFLYCILIGYFIGTVNPSYIIAKIHGFDIREKGSRNAGASNAVILLGKTIGILCALFDIAKTFFAIWLSQKLMPDFALAFSVTAVACSLGHIFPFYMKFKGGKGLACLGGMILAFDWRVFLIMLAIEIVVVLVSDYLCIVPLTASVVFPIVYGIMEKNLWGALMLLVITAVIFYKHKNNLQRIKNGTEMHFSFLWNKDKEIERLKNNMK
ncbi:MAG: glycerol-3-phosphate 1-O-acyltransferase PlsY [Clostridia bacterium]|nr:glycerol-3-phosphate 1-O-acyltransferase PlsY [Clostridia bacterium]